MNIYTLNNKRDMRIQRRKETYRKILETCYNKINSVSEDKIFCFFKIPRCLIGYPLFDIKKSSDYIFNKLVHKGFKVSQIQENYLLIYWGHIPSYVAEPELQERQYKKRIQNIENNNTSKKEEEYRDINDVNEGNQNFIYDLSELNNKLSDVL